MANRHVAQCSAENIMQWCTYLDNFSLNQEIAPVLASEYHNKRVNYYLLISNQQIFFCYFIFIYKIKLKRFSETFFFKDFSRKNLHEYE